MLDPDEFAALLREVEARAANKPNPDTSETAAALERGVPCFQEAFRWLVGELEAKTSAATISAATMRLMGSFGATIAVHVAEPGQEEAVLAMLLAGAVKHAFEALQTGVQDLNGRRQ